MLALHLLVVPLLALPVVSQQQILQFGNGQLPTCAQGCSALTQAQAACVPVPATLKSCFCQSAFLAVAPNDLFKDANAVCTQVCPDQQDRNQIQSWYKNYCAGLNPEAGAAQPTTSTAPAAPTSTAPASRPTSSATSSSSSSSGDDEQPKTWWQAHGRWIAMVIVLVVAFSAIIVLGIWWKKRHDRKVNRATDTPLPAGWGPPTDPHTYPAAAAAAPTREKQQFGEVTATPRPDYGQSEAEKGKSRRLKKLVGR